MTTIAPSPLVLDEERLAALESLRNAYNASANTNLSQGDYLAAVLMGTIEAEQKRLFDQSVSQLSAGAASLPYADRQALIQQIQNSIAQS